MLEKFLKVTPKFDIFEDVFGMLCCGIHIVQQKQLGTSRVYKLCVPLKMGR